MTSAEALLHLRYSAWASRKVMEAARTLPEADFQKPVGVSHGSLQGTLAHILYADWIWFTRVVAPMEEPGQTREALERIGALYGIEEQIRGRRADERRAVRQA